MRLEKKQQAADADSGEEAEGNKIWVVFFPEDGTCNTKCKGIIGEMDERKMHQMTGNEPPELAMQNSLPIKNTNGCQSRHKTADKACR